MYVCVYIIISTRARSHGSGPAHPRSAGNGSKFTPKICLSRRAFYLWLCGSSRIVSDNVPGTRSRDSQDRRTGGKIRGHGQGGVVRFYALVSQQLLSGSHDSLGRGC